MLDLNSDLNTLAEIVTELTLGTTYKHTEEPYVSLPMRVGTLKNHHMFAVR